MKINNKSKCAIAIIISIISEISVILISKKTGLAIDYAIGGNFDKLLRTCLFILLFTMTNNVFFLVSVWLNQKYIKDETVNLRVNLVKSLLSNTLYNFRKKEDAFYTNALTKDIDNLGKEDYGMLVVEAKFMALFVGAVAAMYMINPWLFCIALFFSFMPFFTTLIFEKRIQEKSVICSKQNENMQKEIFQFVQGYEVQKVNCANCNSIVQKVKNISEINGNAILNKETLQCAYYMVLDVVNSFGRLLLIGIGGYLVIQNRITTGELISCTLLAEYICSGMNNFLEVHMGRKSYQPIRQKVHSICRNINNYNSLQQLNGCSDIKVKYENVSMKFEGENDFVLENMNMIFEARKKYLIVGESGCGKSTFVRLILNYYDNYCGKIYIDGIDLKQYSDEQLYAKVGYLGQNEIIFNDTIEDNISLFNNDEERDLTVQKLIRDLGLVELYNKVKGKRLGDFGELISGGERQRIALARVLYKKPEILILDEPFTGLDTYNKNIIMNYVESIDDITLIIISHEHDDSILNKFDKVVRLPE